MLRICNNMFHYRNVSGKSQVHSAQRATGRSQRQSYDLLVTQTHGEPAPEALEIPSRVLRAAIEVITTQGWDGFNLEDVAQAAGVSRVTLWRQGISREALAQALLGRLAEDYRDSMWSVLTSSGTGRQRLVLALRTLCEVADRHLGLLVASDSAFHRAWSERRPGVDFLGPFTRIIEDGAADGTLRPADDPLALADLLFNVVCWPYVHLRARHEWQPEAAAARVIELVLDGVATPRTRA